MGYTDIVKGNLPSNGQQRGTCTSTVLYRFCGATQPSSDTQLLYQCTLLSHTVPFLPRLPLTRMSHHSSASTILPSNFDTLFNRALDTYEEHTNQDLRSHPLFSRLEVCTSSDEVLTILREQFSEFSRTQNTDVRFTKWLDPTMNVLGVSCNILGEAVGLVCIKMLSC